MKKIFNFALYDFANSAFTTIIITFIFATYFAKQIAPNPVLGQSYWGWTIGVTGFLVAVIGPFVGSFADKNNKIVGISKCVEPMVRVTTAKGKAMKLVKNFETDIIPCTIANMERIFAEDILKQKPDNRKGKNKGENLTKSNVNLFTFDKVLKAVSTKLVDFNLMDAEKLVTKVQGEQLSRLKDIAQQITLILAKLETCTTNANAEVKTNNSVLFEMQDKAWQTIVKRHFTTAVFSLSKEPTKESISK